MRSELQFEKHKRDQIGLKEEEKSKQLNFNYLIFSIHCLGLFERYDSIEDIKRGIKSNKIL